jgi:hypothetical protein
VDFVAIEVVEFAHATARVLEGKEIGAGWRTYRLLHGKRCSDQKHGGKQICVWTDDIGGDAARVFP